MRLILRVMGTIFVLLVIGGAIKGLVHGGSVPKRVVQISGTELTIPDDTPKNVFAVTRAAMKQMAYRPWYRNCIIGQAERLLTPAEARRFGRLSKSQGERRGLSLVLKAQPYCEKPGREIVDPNANSTQLSLIRVQVAEAIRLLFAREKSDLRFQTCAANQIKRATDTQTLELANGSRAVQEAVILKLLKPCT